VIQSYNIFDDTKDSLPEGRADFLLAGSVTKTCEIEGLTQAGIPGKIALTPTLDAELVNSGKVFSMPELAETPKGVPTPAVITRAVHNLDGFSQVAMLNLGLEVLPKEVKLFNFDIEPSDAINNNAKIDAKTIFAKGMEFGKKYELQGNYLILAESTPSGTTTALASALALGYNVANDFSSSFLHTPDSLKNKVVQEALALTDDSMGKFEKLGVVSDNMLLFVAGFLVEATRRFHVVVAGGTQMAAALLIADALREDVLKRLKSENLTLATTKWVAKDTNANIKHILEQLSYKPHAIYTEFSFANTEIPPLKMYDEGEAKEGVGAGAALAYAAKNGKDNQELLEAIELVLYELI